jgi:hypothetical protein
MDTKSILVLGRRNHTESMRVAAGLTLLGHDVRLVLMTEPVAESEVNAEQAEILELSDIAPETTVEEMAEDLPLLDAGGLAAAMAAADRVISI